MAATVEKDNRIVRFEEFMNILTRVEPADTPLFSMTPNEAQLGNTEFAWAVDKLKAPRGAVGSPDNAEDSNSTLYDNATNRRKIMNSGQAFRLPYGVGWIQAAVPRTPGVTNEMARASVDMLAVLKEEVECAMASGDQGAASDDGTDGGLMSGFGALSSRSNSFSGSTPTVGKIPSDYLPPAGAQYGATGDISSTPSFTEGPPLATLDLELLKGVVKELRREAKRSRDYVLLCGLDLREQITNLTNPSVQAVSQAGVAAQVRTFTQQISDAELGQSIDVVRTDFGRLLVVPTDWIGATCLDSAGTYTATRASRVFTEKPKWGYVIGREKIGKRWGVSPEKYDIAPMGAGERAGWRAYCSMVHYYPPLSGRLFMSA